LLTSVPPPGVDPVQALVARHSHVDQARLAQHAQVLRGGRLRKAAERRDLARSALRARLPRLSRVSDALRIVAALALVAGNAFFVIGEYAVVTARRGAVAALAERGSMGARAALGLMDDPVRVISTVQVGITAIGILTGAVGEPLVRDLLGDGVPSWLAFVLAFAVVTYLSVVFGELVPKALTLDRAERLAAVVAPPIALIARVFRPVVWVLQRSAQMLLRPFGVRDVIAGEGVGSPAELRALVDEAEQSGVIPRAQEELLHNVFDFAGREVGDVMVPGPDVTWLDADLSPQAALDQIAVSPYSRYPVGRGSLDQLVGVVHVRDVVSALRSRPDEPIGARAESAPVVPVTKDLGALLRELREQRRHLAVVADEYGGTAGIVTLEDVLEEIVGEIEDEYDLPDATLERIDESTLRVAGSLTVDDFNEAVGTDLSPEHARTLAGLVFNDLGRRPEVGDEVADGDVRLTVEETDGARITRLLVRLPARSLH
jgi:putative hemolysin